MSVYYRSDFGREKLVAERCWSRVSEHYDGEYFLSSHPAVVATDRVSQIVTWNR